MLRAADSQVTAAERRAAAPASPSPASLLAVVFFGIEFELKMIHVRAKADLCRLREAIFSHAQKEIITELFHYTANGPEVNYLP